MKRFKVGFGLGFILILLFGGGCPKLSGRFSSPLPSKIKVGIIVSSNEKEERERARAFEQGLRLAAREINKNKGPDQPEVELIIMRGRRKTPIEPLKLALKMEEKKVSAVFCYISPAETKVFLPLASRLKRPVFLQNGLFAPFPSYVYSLLPSEEIKGAYLALFALDTLKKKKAAIFYSRRDLVQREKAYTFEKTFRERQGEVVLIRPYPLASPQSVYSELKRTEPEVLFLALNARDREPFLKELSNRWRIQAELLFGNDLSKNEAKLSGGGYLVRFHPFSIANFSGFSQQYREEFKSNPLPVSFSAYLGLHLFHKAVVKARTLDGNLLEEALATVKAEKAGAQYWLGKERILRGPVYFYRLSNDGQMVLVKAESLPF